MNDEAIKGWIKTLKLEIMTLAYGDPEDDFDTVVRLDSLINDIEHRVNEIETALDEAKRQSRSFQLKNWELEKKIKELEKED